MILARLQICLLLRLPSNSVFWLTARQNSAWYGTRSALICKHYQSALQCPCCYGCLPTPAGSTDWQLLRVCLQLLGLAGTLSIAPAGWHPKQGQHDLKAETQQLRLLTSPSQSAGSSSAASLLLAGLQVIQSDMLCWTSCMRKRASDQQPKPHR